MMPFGSECCKDSKLHVDLFPELVQNVAKAPNYMWICFRSRTQGVPLTMEF